MSSTNKTTNYELSQFIGTDKPAWLTDYNADMGKIDAGIHSAKSTADGADGKATANTSAIGTIANLTTDAKTNLVAAVNEVDSHADTALNTASTAAGNASQALTTANGLAAYLSITPTAIPSNKVITSNGTVNSSELTIALNSTNTFGKLYGIFGHTPATSGNQVITLNIDSGIHPDTAFTISPAGIATQTDASISQAANYISATFNPNGTITLEYWGGYANKKYNGTLFPCCYFFTDFGDTPAES